MSEESDKKERAFENFCINHQCGRCAGSGYNRLEKACAACSGTGFVGGMDTAKEAIEMAKNLRARR